MRDYSDLSFKHHPERISIHEKSHLRIYPEGKKRKKMSVGQELCMKTTYKQIMTSDNITNLLNFDERASTASIVRDPQDIMGGQIDAIEKASGHGSIPVDDRMPSVASTT